MTETEVYTTRVQRPRRSVTKQSRSCDACRSRKVRCDRAPPVLPESHPSPERCGPCKAIDIPCIFTGTSKRRGPRSRYAPQAIIPDIGSSRQGLQSECEATGSGTAGEHRHLVIGVDSDMMCEASIPVEWSLQPSDPALDANTNVAHDDAHITADSERPLEGEYVLDQLGHNLAVDLPKYPYDPGNPIDNILPRGLLLFLVNHHFRLVYPLMPILDQNSFMHDLATRREMNAGQDEWIALVLSVAAVTLTQLPHSMVPLAKQEARAIATRCYLHVKGYQNLEQEHMSVNRMISLVLSIAAMFDRKIAASAIRGSLAAIMFRMRQHDPRTYATFPAAESEIRKRIFWIIYGGDKTLALLEDHPIMFSEDDCHSVELPCFMESDLALQSPEIPQRTSVLIGFVYICKLHRHPALTKTYQLVAGLVIGNRRRDRRIVPTGMGLNTRLCELEELYKKVMELMQDSPEVLRLNMNRNGFPFDTAASLGARDFTALSRQLLDQASTPQDPFLVQQANIYVTQQALRYCCLQYKAELCELRDAEASSAALSAGLAPVTTALALPLELRIQVATDLLSVLRAIPTRLAAVNSRPLLTKIRFVALALLDDYTIHTGDHPPFKEDATPMMTTETLVQESQQRLFNFLGIMSQLESMFSMPEESTANAQ